MKKFIAATIITIATLVASSQAVMAKPILSMDITDPNAETMAGGFHNDVMPGTERSYSVTVRNNSPSVTSTFYVYPTDVISKLNGGKDFKAYGEEVTGYGKWIQLEQQKITLKPNQAKDIKFKVKFPKDMKYGQYISYVALQEYRENAETHGEEGKAVYSINDLTKIGIQIIADYKSEKSKSILSFSRFEKEYLSGGLLSLSGFVKNDGTILARPEVSITVSNLDSDDIVFKDKVSMDSVYGNSEAQSYFVMQDNYLPKGNYKVLLEGSWSGEKFSREFKFSIDKADVKQSVAALEDKGEVKVIETQSTWQTIIMYVLGGVVLLIIFILFKRKKKDKPEEVSTM